MDRGDEARVSPLRFLGSGERGGGRGGGLISLTHF